MIVDGRCTEHPLHIFRPVPGGIERVHLLERGAEPVDVDFIETPDAEAPTTGPILEVETPGLLIRFAPHAAWLALAAAIARWFVDGL